MESRVADIESELKCYLEKVSWLPGFYAIRPEIQIAGSKAYQQGKVRRNSILDFSALPLIAGDIRIIHVSLTDCSGLV
jgi:hypothetical protein